MGIVGSTIANNILVGFFDVGELYICDIDKGNLLGQYRDLSDAKKILRRDLKIYPVANPVKADIHIICVGDRFYINSMSELMPENYKLVSKLINGLDGKIIIVTNPSETITSKLKGQGFDVSVGGDLLDRVRESRGYTGKEIRLLKGYTNFGISAEILLTLRKMTLKLPQ
jgi:malate/lactate dehydrogenase